MIYLLWFVEINHFMGTKETLFFKGKPTNHHHIKSNKLKCNKCKEVLSTSNFYKNKSNWHGFAGQCKKCDKKNTESQWKRLGSNPSKMWARLYSLTGSRKQKGELKKQHEIKFSKDEFKTWYEKLEKKCFYCEITINDFLKIKQKFGSNHSKVTKFGFDRKYNDKPYEFDNIVLCCSNCNNRKGYIFNSIEFKSICDQFIKPKIKSFLNE